MVKINRKQKKPKKPKIIPPLIRVSHLDGVLADLLILGVIIAAWISIEVNPTIYRLSLQEDQVVEWMTFWAFFISGLFFIQAAYRQHVNLSKVPWFLIGIVLFCFFVAMEEISWGQRLFGYRPPAYFLDQNFQQEFNFHNIVDKTWRKLTLKIIIVGFGIVLPVLWLIPTIRKLFWKMAIVPPPLFFTPAFLATYCLYEFYPWRFSGELVELMLGLGFIFSAMALTSFFKKPFDIQPSSSFRLIALVVIIFILSFSMVFIGNASLRHQPELVDVTKKEIIALRNDFREAVILSKEPISRCGLHTRIFTFVQKYKVLNLHHEQFWNLTKQGLPEERAHFFIDPWNTAYWIWQVCDIKQEKIKIFIYSFGPNRIRDSVPWEIKGDDIGIVVYEDEF